MLSSSYTCDDTICLAKSVDIDSASIMVSTGVHVCNDATPMVVVTIDIIHIIKHTQIIPDITNFNTLLDQYIT
jgi:hypothetical protein